ncbi:MAG TPA: substrate-binding domain-containing protein [Burkholderiales bacterium]
MVVLSSGPRVLSTLALKGVLAKLAPQLDVEIHATKALMEMIEREEPADLLILTSEAIGRLEREGKVREVRPLGSSGVGVAVRAGAPRPDIGSAEALKRAFVDARSVAHSKVGASGIYFIELIRELGIADRVRTVVVARGPVGEAVASGEAELGVQQLCELAPVAGIDIVGPFPEPLQRTTSFSAGIPVAARERERGRTLLELLCSDRGRAAMVQDRMRPA